MYLLAKEIDNIKQELTNKSQILEVRNNELNAEKDRNQKEISNYENKLGELENQLNLSRNELAVKIDDILNFKDKEYIIDVSGGLEDIPGKKSNSKFDKFLNVINKA